MRTASIVLVAVLAAALGTHASAAPETTEQAKVRICGQIRNGPPNSWAPPSAAARQLGLPARFRGRTWTVLARGTSCAFAMQSSRKVLRRWGTTRRGMLIIRDHGVRGYICSKTRTPRGGKGHAGGQCLFLGIGRTFAFYQLGSLSLPQVRRIFARGGFPTG